MSEVEAGANIVIEHLPEAARGDAFVSDELARITAAVRTVAPEGAAISFEFDGKLHMHIDIRGLEDVARVETLLPGLCGGIFTHIQRGLVENHPFLTRLTASVAR